MSDSRFGPARLAGALLLAWGGLALAPGAWAQGNNGAGQGQGADITAASTASARTTSFDIPAQDLGTALAEFGRQSGQELFFAPDAVVGKVATPVSGSLSRQQAIDQLLQGSGLEFLFTPDGGLMVGEPEAVERYKLQLQQRSEGQGGDVAANADVDPNANGELFDPSVDVTPAPGGTTQVELARRRGVEEIIVTGQKRAERLQDVPIAISAFTMEDLTTSQIAGGPDLHLQVPNMTFTKTNFSGYSIQIRGIGTQAISATTDPAVAVALNNTPFVRNRFFEQEFFDLERLEVLRGPQGTLYGRNATAGVVNLITAKPTFDPEAKLSLDYGNYGNKRYDAMLNLPLVEDALALRIAGAGTNRDGYAVNEITGSPIDGRDLWSTRTSLRFAPPGAGFEANLIWEHFEEDDGRLRSGKQSCFKDVVSEVNGIPVDYFQGLPDTGQAGGTISNVQSVFSQGCSRNSLYANDSYQTPNGLSVPYYYQLQAIGLPGALTDPYVSSNQSRDLRTIESTVDPDYWAKTDIGQLQMAFDLTETLKLESETAYGTDIVFSQQDFNRFNTAPGAWTQSRPQDRDGVLQEGPDGGIFCDPQLGCSDRLVAVDISTAESRQMSQELRLSSQFEGPFNFSLGANYLRYDTEDKYYVFFNSISMMAALSADTGTYVPGVTDNSDCLTNGLRLGDPLTVYPVTSCVYIDPNPIGSLNDEGHNYFLSRNPYELRSYAFFGETYLNVTDNLKVTAGFRWSVDRKTAPRIPSWILAGTTAGYPVAEVVRQEWREPTGRLVVDWKPQLDFTDETLVYGSFSRGYKAGGANPPTYAYTCYSGCDLALGQAQESATRPNTFDAEFVDAFEIGTKNTFADGAITLNMAAFFYDYEGYQVSEIVDRSAFNRNFDAKIWGAELEADWWVKDNLRLGLKAGYQKTRIADGEQAIDLMDRTAGNEDWSVIRPFPTYASSCILPTWLYTPPGGTTLGGASPLLGLGSPNGGGPAGCEYAYLAGLDPVTRMPYEPFPTAGGSLNAWEANGGDYPGFDPASAPNNGEGFFKPLGGNELPNAPNHTTTLLADFIVPLKGDWLATLHADIYWQSASWWRLFNDHEYNRLNDYFTMNVAAIFAHPSSGWNIMAYVKNVTDETAITGAFLGSDDTGLTTNLFLTEPRLYGLRVTKTWGSGSYVPIAGRFGGMFSPGSENALPITLEIVGQMQQVDAPNAPMAPTFMDAFAAPLDIADVPQSEDLGWGSVREAKLAYAFEASPWSVFVGYREGTISDENSQLAEWFTEPTCILKGGPLAGRCDLPNGGATTGVDLANYSIANHVDVEARDREKYTLLDLGARFDLSSDGISRSVLELGLRRGRFTSVSTLTVDGVPDWFIPELVKLLPPFPGELITHTVYASENSAHRSFSGVGPALRWEASRFLTGDATRGGLAADWEVSAGMLFGDHEVSFSGQERSRAYQWTIVDLESGSNEGVVTEESAYQTSRTRTEQVPFFGLGVGFSYRIPGASIAAGYRWERYVNVLDGGFESPQSVDRTMDGPYMKITFGAGGQD